MSAVADTLEILARVLDGQGLPWFVFGAQAVTVRGAPRATQDIDITVEGRDVTVSGRRDAPEAPGAGTVRAGRRHGAFENRLHLGRALDHEAVEADYANGVLKLVVPLAEVPRTL